MPTKFGLSVEPPVMFGRTEPASIKLGGIIVYARTSEDLSKSLNLSDATITQFAEKHMTFGRNVIRKALRDALRIDDVPQRLLSALLGHVLRRGNLDAVICASKNDLSYRVFYHESKIALFERAVEWARTQAERRGFIEVAEVERHIFSTRKFNTWSSSSHVVGRLGFLGVVRHVDDFSAQIVNAGNAK